MEPSKNKESELELKMILSYQISENYPSSWLLLLPQNQIVVCRIVVRRSISVKEGLKATVESCDAFLVNILVGKLV